MVIWGRRWYLVAWDVERELAARYARSVKG
jgi:predicted DNA-binding transcriptional regulator YafY